MPDGNIEYLGRMDFQVKIRGFRIELGEIEFHLLQHPSIQEAVVVARNDKGNNPILCAYFVSCADLSTKELREHLGRLVPDYMVPSHFIRLNTIPLTQNGKADRKALPPPELELQRKFAEPSSDLEKKLAQMWQDILGIPQIGINDDFFDLGGNSLNALRMISRLQKKGFTVSMNDIFLYSNISKMAQFLSSIREMQKVVDSPEHVCRFLEDQYHVHTELVPYPFHEKPGAGLYVLYYEERDVHESELLSIVERHLSKRIYPYYVFPFSKKPLTDSSGQIDEGTLLKHWDIKTLRMEDVCHIEEEINRKLKAYESTIACNPVKAKFPLSTIQRGQLRLKFQLSGAVMPYYENIKADILEQAFRHLVERHKFLRSTLIKEGVTYQWQEHEAPLSLSIPIVDLSGYSVETSLLYELINRISIIDLAERCLLYKVVLLKMNWREYYLVLPCHHMIHDQTCTEIIRRELSQFCEDDRLGSEREEETPYIKYIDLLRQGPIGIMPDELIDVFNLKEYRQVRRQVEQLFAGREKKKKTYHVHKIHFKTEIEKEQSFQISYYLINVFLARYLGMDKIPMKILCNARSYCNKNFYDTIGEFIDFVPVLVDIRNDFTSVIKDSSKKIQLTSKKNINFMSLFMDDSLRKKWQQVYECIRPDFINWNDMTIVFNFLGKGDLIEIERFIDLYHKANEEPNDIIPDISSFYCEVLFTPEDLYLFIQIKLQEDVSTLRELLEIATAKALRHYLRSM